MLIRTGRMYGSGGGTDSLVSAAGTAASAGGTVPAAPAAASAAASVCERAFDIPEAVSSREEYRDRQHRDHDNMS